MTNSQKLRLTSTHALKLIVVILALACCGYAHSPVKSAPPPTRDWTLYPAVVEVDTEEDFAAVSDPHGSYDRLSRVIQATGWVSTGPPPIWTFHRVPGDQRAVLIVVGDLIDGGSDSLKVIQLLRALQKDASAKGGRVIVTMGNHEAEFLANWNGGKTAKFRDELTAAGLNPQSVANCEGDLGQWLCNLPLAARVNDWFFCHAGNTKGRTISQLNSDIARSFNDEPVNGFKAPEITGENSILTARLDTDIKKKIKILPWFMVGNSTTNPEALLRNYVEKLGVKHIVQGHKPGKVKFPTADGSEVTRQKEDMFQAYNGLLFLIDADMSGKTEGGDSIGASLFIKGPIRQRSDYGGNVTAFVNCPNPRFYGRVALWDSTKPEAFTGQHCNDN
ncbi:MAG TPA: metallophosphoesterase [Pyrinomonadaceae bacterium]|nr:metallophosphoesterase [Pyrinomonadaceae bacterium]